jgi:serine/threonine-protein kinase
MNEFFQRLKQRKLVQWAIAYVVAAFALLQGIDVVAQQFGWPEGVRRGITLGLVIGFLLTLVLAWYHGERGAQRVTGAELLVIGLVLALGGGLLWRFAVARSEEDKASVPPNDQNAEPAVALSEKSIAVLPFENLSGDQENAYFTDGVQDEILTHLAKIAGLKVISRTSVMQYKAGVVRNLREIGQQLGVAHVVEGSVQRVANRVRVNAQLIDAHNDTHLWAQSYDRDLADVFGIQTEIAQTIAEQLRTKISPGEQLAVAHVATRDLVANALYAQARELELETPEHESLLKAVQLLDEAVARSQDFVLAWCQLARLHLSLYFAGYDHTPTRRDLARIAVENAERLQPDMGEVHLARAHYYFHGFRDYESARAELLLAQRTLPNDADVYFLSGAINRRQGRSAEAIKNFERAIELDPRNVELLWEGAVTYGTVRRYADESRLLRRALAVSPTYYSARIGLAFIPFYEHADLRALNQLLSEVLNEDPGGAERVAYIMFPCAIAERDRAMADRAIAAMPPGGVSAGGNFVLPREWYSGFAARTFNDRQLAQSSFTAARGILEKLVTEQPDYAPAWSLLGWIDAGLGRSEDAAREGSHACELLPVSKDAGGGAELITNLATIYAWCDKKDLALDQLALSARIPWGVNYGELKLNPQWDDLRGDPRFDKIVASLAPKELLK